MKVSFYLDVDGEVFAVFLGHPAYLNDLLCYREDGTQTTCSRRYLNGRKLATHGRYSPLLKLLESMGYNELEVINDSPKIKNKLSYIYSNFIW